MSAIEVSDELAELITSKAASQGLSPDSWLKGLLADIELPETEHEEQTKLDWLRASAAQGFDALDTGDYVTLHSDSDISSLLNRLRETASAQLAAERDCG